MTLPDDVRAASARRSTAWLLGLALLVLLVGVGTVVVPELRDAPEEPDAQGAQNTQSTQDGQDTQGALGTTGGAPPTGGAP